MTDHALMLVGRIAAQGPSPTVSQPPHWLSVAQATGAVATTIGVMPQIADTTQHRSMHSTAPKRSAAAQARKVVPSCVRTPMFGDSWWTVRIDNASNAMTTLLAVEVTALDTNGFEVIGGCRQVNNTMSVDQVFDRSIRPRYRICRRADLNASSCRCSSMRYATRW
jgi:hypothetical protein